MANKKNTKNTKDNSLNPYIGYFISTLLLFFLRKKSSSGSTNEQTPSKYTDSNGNQIGNAIPVVLGRCMIKNPLISFYGDFKYRIYTEEYGMHTKLDVWSFLLPLILFLLAYTSKKDVIKMENGKGQEQVDNPPSAPSISGTGNVGGGTVPPSQNEAYVQRAALESEPPGGQNGWALVGTTGGGTTVPVHIYSATEQPNDPVSYKGGLGVTTTIEHSETAKKRNAIVQFIIALLLWLLLNLFTKHAGRTTIQKGFLYYLGWQHIICWTGENIGIKRLWMNVYDPNVEQSTNKGVWDNSGHIAWRSSNPTGIIAHINDDQMFGGWDEGGGFIGDVRFYLGGYAQPKDPWMINQMTVSANIPNDLKGLTPRYPMYFTCVIPTAYIGKQATIPEMWFEVVNYPNWLQKNTSDYREELFKERMKEYMDKLSAFITKQATEVQDAIQKYYDKIVADVDVYIDDGSVSLATIKSDITALRNNYPPSEVDLLYIADTKLYNLVDHGVWHLGRLGDDLNPAEAIYEILTNKIWGCHYEGDRIDVKSLVRLGATCEDEGYGISMLMTQISQAKEYINKIMSHINAVHFDDPKTGKLTFKCIRNDFDENKLKIFDTSNCQDMEFTRVDWSEITSTISAKFTDASTKYTDSELFVYDLANRIITGSYTSSSVDASYFTTALNARNMAQTQLLSAGYPLAAINFNCNRYGFDVLVGDPIVVSWEPYGISKQVYRVTNVDYATLTNGLIKITAVEDVFSFDKTEYLQSDAPTWTEPKQQPWEIARWKFLELPYEMSFSLDTYVGAFAAQPSEYTVYWNVWRYILSKSDYMKTAKSSKWSLVGRMVDGFPESFYTDADGFEFYPVGIDSETMFADKYQTLQANPYIYNNKNMLNLIFVDDEIMSYDSMEEYGDEGHYKLKGVMRGLFDTLPKPHTHESIVFFIDYYLDINGSDPVALEGEISEEQLELTTETREKEAEFDITKLEFFNTVRRSERPSVMANLTFGADRGTEIEYEYYINSNTAFFAGDILFDFLGRNKFSSYGIVEQTDDRTIINVADTTKNIIRTTCNGVTFEEEFDATKVLNGSSMELLCVGDSLTYPTGGWTWVTTTQDDLVSYNVNVSSLTNSHMTTQMALDKFDTDIVPLLPTALLLWVGIEDLWYGNAIDYQQATRNFSKIISKCLENGIIPIVALSTFTVEQIEKAIEKNWSASASPYPAPAAIVARYLNMYNDYCSSLALAKRIKVVSPVESIKISTDVINKTMVSDDLFHLSYLGAETVGHYIASAIVYIFISINITSMRYKWADFCKNMGSKINFVNDVTLEIMTYDTKRQLYSYDKYVKQIEYRMPRFIGVVESADDVFDYAQSLVYTDYIIIDQSDYTPQVSMSYNACGLIFVGEKTTDPDYIIGQDGEHYKISDEAYRIDGLQDGYYPVIHKVDIEKEYVIRSNFNTYLNNKSLCYRYLGGTEWELFTI